MNSEQAKKLSLPTILEKLGHKPVKILKNGQELWYNSPFRKEIEPSFHTSFLGGKWIWNDFGDSGGSVLDFAMRFYNQDVKGALNSLESLIGNQQKSLFYAPPVPLNDAQATLLPEDTKTLSLRKISPLSIDSFNGRALLQYLTEKRGIDADIAIKYLVEVQYRNNENGKTYFAVGIKNENEGYEIRNAYFKSSIGQKGVSVIKGKKGGSATVFEGFMDFLSALTYFQTKDLSMFQNIVESDVLIMNSASFHERTKEFLQSNQYNKVSLFLDNDTTGFKVKNMLLSELKEIISDYSNLYQDHKDFNLFLLSVSINVNR